MTKKFYAILALATLLLASCASLAAGESVEATVLEVDAEQNIYVIETEDGSLFEVQPSEDVDVEGIEAGDVISIQISEEGELTVVVIEDDPEAEVVELDDQAKNESDRGRWCENGEPTGDSHPQGETIAATYDVPYEWVMMRFCQGYGFGEIKIALNLSIAANVDKDHVFELKSQLGGWGKVRQELGVTGNPHPNKNKSSRGPKK